MARWRNCLKFDLIKPLLESDNEAIGYFTCRDLLDEKTLEIDFVWDLPEVIAILRKQQPDGSWKYPDKVQGNEGVKYSLLETRKRLRYLVDQYEMNRQHPAVEKASEFVFSC
jgi:hypothetical protein